MILLCFVISLYFFNTFSKFFTIETGMNGTVSVEAVVSRFSDSKLLLNVPV